MSLKYKQLKKLNKDGEKKQKNIPKLKTNLQGGIDKVCRTQRQELNHIPSKVSEITEL